MDLKQKITCAVSDYCPAGMICRCPWDTETDSLNCDAHCLDDQECDGDTVCIDRECKEKPKLTEYCRHGGQCPENADFHRTIDSRSIQRYDGHRNCLECREDAHCQGARKCSEDRCTEPPCSGGSDCAEGTKYFFCNCITGGKQGTTCIDSAECEEELYCVDNTCHVLPEQVSEVTAIYMQDKVSCLTKDYCPLHDFYCRLPLSMEF